jgi:hypothetical protein
MNRYCVLSLPRTGSTWLLEGIGESIEATDNNFINLGEFFTPTIVANRNYEKHTKYFVDEKNIIKKVKTSEPVLENTEHIINFVNNRINILTTGNTEQSIVVKYMYANHVHNKINDLEILNKIQNHNFTVVNINRNPFTSAISYLIGRRTNVWIRSTNWDCQHIDAIAKTTITAPTMQFKVTYSSFLKLYQKKQQLANRLKCVTVNYESLVQDCLINNIPFNENNNCKKLYNVDYTTLITNYDELLNVKDEVDNTLE